MEKQEKKYPTIKLYEKQPDGSLKQVGAIWTNTSKNGKTYYSVRLNNMKFLGFDGNAPKTIKQEKL